MVFTGNFEHTIDTKNRLAIPSEIRKLLRRHLEDSQTVILYVTVDESRRALCVWPEARFEQRAAELDRSERPASEILPYERIFFSLASMTELDKQGRIRLPENLLQMCNFNQEVAIIGVKDHLEVWDRQTWQQHMTQMLEQHPGILMNPRLASESKPS